MINPRDVVPESVMPGYPWLDTTPADASDISERLATLRMLGVPYTDEDIKNAPKQLEGKTELDALIAYMQSLGTTIPAVR
jgi:cytochrome c oxidase cbb3-type subunit 2